MRRKIPQMLINDMKNIIIDIDKIIKTWENSIYNLYKGQREEHIEHLSNEVTGSPIMKSEMEYALMNSKLHRALRPDKIPTDLLKLIKDGNINILNYSTQYIKLGKFQKLGSHSHLLSSQKKQGKKGILIIG